MANQRMYNALTGAELKTVIKNEVDRALDRAGINSSGVTYPLASWSWSLTILQQDATGNMKADTPERIIATGQTVEQAIAAANFDPDVKRMRDHPDQIVLSEPSVLSDAELDELTKPEDRMSRALRGGSKRFKNHPPSPTEVREAENLPLPEA